MPLLAELDPFFHSLCPHSIGCLALQLDQTMTGLEGLYGGRQERLQPGEKDTVGTVTDPEPKHLWPSPRSLGNPEGFPALKRPRPTYPARPSREGACRGYRADRRTG
jgi:hypothetical protein